MQKKHILLLFIVSLLVFTPYFYRADLVGYDSYAFLNYVCDHDYVHAPLNQNTPLATLILDLIPCNLFAIKLVLWFSFFLTILITARMGEYVHSMHGWMAGIFLFMAILFVQYFVRFENDQLAMPFITLGMLILVRSHYEIELPAWFGFQRYERYKKGIYKLIALACLGIASLIWGAAGFVIIGMALLDFWLFLPAMFILAIYGKSLFAAAAGNPIIVENAPVLAIVSLAFLNYAFFLPILAPLTYFLGIIALLNSKFAILVTPLLAVSLVELLKRSKLKKFTYVALYLALFLGLGLGMLQLTHAPPKSFEWDSLDYGIALHNSTGKPLLNEFSYGYMLDYKGHEAENYAFYDPDWLDDHKGKIIITPQEIDCPYELFTDGVAKGIRVYNC